MRASVASLAVLVSLALAHSAKAQDGAAAETALKNCVVLKTTGQDRLTLGRWLAGTLGTAPQVSDVVKVDPQVREAVDRAFAATFTRIVTHDCLAEAKALGSARDGKAFKIVGEAMGELGVQELMLDPAANEAMGSFAKHLKEEDFLPLK